MKLVLSISYLLIILLINQNVYAKEIKRITRRNATNKCEIRIPGDIPVNEPLYLLKMKNNSLSYYKPIGRDNFFNINDKLHLYCPGKRNQMRLVNELDATNHTELICKGNNQFSSSIKSYENLELKQVNCLRKLTTELQQTNFVCGNKNGIINKIGYNIFELNEFLPLFEVCYSNKTASAIYSKHLINGKTIKFGVREDDRRDFKLNGIPYNVKASKVYLKVNQIKNFEQLLGAEQTFFNNTIFLSRGHLTPDADFIFASGQFATYFYVNVAPQFQTINAGNWLRVEWLAKNLAAQLQKDLIIYTGVYDQLKLPNQNGDYVPLFMDGPNRKIEVPKWFWKVLIDEQTNTSIVFITLNNPFASQNNVEEFCPNICVESGLNTKHFSKIGKGYTFCCKLNDFKNIVKAFPSNVNASNNLMNCSNVNE